MTCLEFIATACAGIFSGAAVYVSVVQHPAVIEVAERGAGTDTAPHEREQRPNHQLGGDATGSRRSEQRRRS
jgi:hypothetical protein